MSRCPSEQKLNDFLEEQVTDADQAAIAGHVDGCEKCQARLEEMTGEVASIHAGSAVLGRRDDPALTPHNPSTRMEALARIKENPPSRGGAEPGLSSHGSRGGSGRRGEGDGVPLLQKLPIVLNYEILGELGRGGMGVVYKARQVGLDRLVALKMILAGKHAGPKELARFRQEAEAVARLRHPNIIQVYDIGESEGRPFLALEFVEGQSLSHLLMGQPQPLAPAARLIETLAGAIHYAHQRNIVHRDLKPANILLQLGDAGAATDEADSGSLGSFVSALARPGQCVLQSALAKITDFGLAKRLDDRNPGTQTGDVVGTPSYMAPEQARSTGKVVGPATDVYALGAILYELLTGRPPFRGATSLDTVLQVLHEDPVRPSELRRDLPRDLETITLKCLAKDPAKRYASAEALAEDLHRYRKGKPIKARPVAMHERVWKWARHRPVIASLVGGMLLTAVLGFAGITWQWREARLAQNDAEKKRQEAVDARINEAEQRKRAGASLYYSRIAQSQLQWRVNDFPSAKRTLVSCLPTPGQEDHRGWEWHYLQGLFHNDLFTLPHSHGGQGGGIAYDPRGEGRIASVVSGPTIGETVQPGEVKIWDARTGEALHACIAPSTAHRIVYSPDGKRLALATNDGQVMVWDAVSFQEIVHKTMHPQAIWALAYSPDGKWIASAGGDGIVRLWDSTTGAVKHEFRGHTKEIQSVAFHPTRPVIASGSWDKSVKLWDTETGTLLQTLQEHKLGVLCVAFSPDGLSLVSAGNNGNTKFWDLATGRVIQSLTGDTGAVLSLAFSPDGRYLAKAGKDGSVRIWHINAGVERIIFRGHNAPVECVQFSPDARRVVSISPGEGVAKVWDLTRHPTYATFARTDADVEAIAFSENGQRLLSVTMAGKLQVWEGSTGLLLDERALPLHKSVVSPGVPVTFAVGGKLLAGRSAENPRIVQVRETMTGTEQMTFKGHTLPVTCMAFSGDARLLVTCACSQQDANAAHEIKVWEVGTGQTLATLTGAGKIFNVALSPDAKLLAWGGQDGVFGLLDWQNPKTQVKIVGHHADVSALAFHRDGSLLASAGMEDRTVKTWEVEKLLMGSTLPRHALAGPSLICELSFSPDGKRLAAASRDMVKMWETENGHEVLTLRGAPQRYWDQPFNPRLAFSPDGTQLAGTNWDESISNWEAPPLDTEAQFARFQEKRRRFADQRTGFWHLMEAELCLTNKNVSAGRFHLNRLSNENLSPPLELRRQKLESLLN